MNDYVQRNEISPVDRVAPRPVAPVVAVRPGDNSGPEVDARAPALPISPVDHGEGADIDADSEAQLASAAEYARIHAKVVDMLASVRLAGESNEMTVGSTDGTDPLIPTPIVIVPMFPASQNMIEQAARVAQRMLDDALLARAAQAHIMPGTVDQILSPVA